MNERYKEFSYEITDDPRFRDDENAMTEELREEIEEIYPLISEKRANHKIIERIIRLIEKHPKNPQLKNFLSVAYKSRDNLSKAREVNRWILAEHPDYLFGKLNLAAEYYETKQYEKMTEVLGNMMEIQDLYSDRKVFHLAEVTGFYRFAVMYFTAIGNFEAAESRYDILKRIAPDHPDTEQALTYLMTHRFETNLKRIEEDNKTKIRVSTPDKIKFPQTTEKPTFHHKEIYLLYQKGLYIGWEELDKILSLPRESLISDLETVLRDCITRYGYFQKQMKKDGWNEETHSFAIHAMYLLGELRSEQSLDKVLEFFRQGEKFLEFYFCDFITDALWEPLYYLANTQTDKLKTFLFEPSIYTYAKTEIGSMISQIAWHQPERRDEVINLFKDVFQFMANCRVEENIVDSDVIGLLICDVIELNANELLPEIEKLFELGYVSKPICGDLEAVRKDFKRPFEHSRKKALMNIYNRYDNITSEWAGYQETDADYEDDFSITQPVSVEKKTGRNEPCPCGSGKKYKKCCLNKL